MGREVYLTIVGDRVGFEEGRLDGTTGDTGGFNIIVFVKYESTLNPSDINALRLTI